MFRCYCDHCGQEIRGALIRFEGQNVDIQGGSWFSKHYHPDCFNYKFSTDWKKVEKNGDLESK